MTDYQLEPDLGIIITGGPPSLLRFILNQTQKIENYEQFTTGQETSDYIFIQSIKLELDNSNLSKNLGIRSCYIINPNHRGLGLSFDKIFKQ